MLERLTAKQKAFVDCYTKSGNITASVREAGYSHIMVKAKKCNVKIS